MKKTIKQVLQFLLFLAIGIFLLWIAFRNVRFSDLSAGLMEANYSFVILAVIFDIFAFLSRAKRWNLLIYPMGYRPAYRNTFNSMMTGYFANMAIPRIGEITRCVALGKKEKIPVDKLIGTVVIERAIDMISVVIILIIMIFTSGDKINQFLRETILIPFREKVLSPFGLTWLIWLALPAFAGGFIYLVLKYRKNLRKIPFISKIFDLSKGIIQGLKSIRTLERKWEFIFHTVFMWVCYLFMTWMVVFAIDNTSHLSIGDAVFLLVIGSFAMIAPVPSGIGAFHYIISRGLAFVQGVDLEDGALYAILTHESQMILVIIMGAVATYLIFRKSKKNDAENPA